MVNKSSNIFPGLLFPRPACLNLVVYGRKTQDVALFSLTPPSSLVWLGEEDVECSGLIPSYQSQQRPDYLMVLKITLPDNSML